MRRERWHDDRVGDGPIDEARAARGAVSEVGALQRRGARGEHDRPGTAGIEPIEVDEHVDAGLVHAASRIHIGETMQRHHRIHRTPHPLLPIGVGGGGRHAAATAAGVVGERGPQAARCVGGMRFRRAVVASIGALVRLCRHGAIAHSVGVLAWQCYRIERERADTQLRTLAPHGVERRSHQDGHGVTLPIRAEKAHMQRGVRPPARRARVVRACAPCRPCNAHRATGIAAIRIDPSLTARRHTQGPPPIDGAVMRRKGEVSREHLGLRLRRVRHSEAMQLTRHQRQRQRVHRRQRWPHAKSSRGRDAAGARAFESGQLALEQQVVGARPEAIEGAPVARTLIEVQQPTERVALVRGVPQPALVVPDGLVVAASVYEDAGHVQVHLGVPRVLLGLERVGR